MTTKAKLETSKLETQMLTAMQQADAVTALDAPALNRREAQSYLAIVCERAGKTPEEIRSIRQHIESLPPIDRYRPVHVTLKTLVGLTLEHWMEPPEHEFPSHHKTGIPDPELAMCLLDLGISRHGLVAVAADIAIEQHPEIFEKGYSDRAAHEAKRAEAQKVLTEILTRAASCWGMDDIEFHSGVATFKISQGRVPVGNGPGDVRAIEQLLQWMRQPKAADPEQESGEVVELMPGQARRV